MKATPLVCEECGREFYLWIGAKPTTDTIGFLHFPNLGAAKLALIDRGNSLCISECAVHNKYEGVRYAKN
jgi:hypothetical protein